MNEWVSVADVCDVSPDTYLTAAAREWMQIRGEKPLRTCAEPTYTISANKTPCFISGDYEIGSCQKVGEIEVCRRRATAAEYKKLQTFPQSYEFPPYFNKGEKTKCIGNAVPPQLAESIAEEL